MKIYLNQNVFDAALDRMRRLFDEFENIVVNFSGGKDSTVTLNLALIVAEEKGRLPLNVMFIDQEAEWQSVIDYIRLTLNDPRIKPYWLQVPIKIFNATSAADPWLHCWRDGDEWIREKEPNSIHQNVYGTDRFTAMFTKFGEHHFPNAPMCNLGGVRAEESPARLSGLTSYATYKDITWGKVENKKINHYVFYPLYDWSYTDIWKAIHDNQWPYCPLYDSQYQYGIQVRNMRVSNVHHETAIDSLRYLQELEPETWNRITERLAGVNAVPHLRMGYHVAENLPYMFTDWREYRDHLLDNLITDTVIHGKLKTQFDSYDKIYEDEKTLLELRKTQINCILVNDYHGTKMSTFRASHGKFSKNKGQRRYLDATV